MSDDNKNSEQPFDFDFDALNEEESQEKPGDSAFDLDNPFGDDVVVTRSEPGESQEKPGDSGFDLNNPFGDDVVVTRSEPGESQEKPSDSGFDLDNPFGDDLAPLSREPLGSESGVSADNPYLDDFSADGSAASSSFEGSAFEDSAVGESSEIDEDGVPSIDAEEETTGKKKKGFLGGLFGGGKKKAPKGKATKEKKTKEKQPKKGKKEKGAKDGETSDKPAVPRDWGTILCIAFSVFLLVSFLMFNIGTLLVGGGDLLPTLGFLGAFNLVGLALVAVPILFYRFPQERTLPNVMLGLSVGAMFTGVLFHVHNFYWYYGFAISP